MATADMPRAPFKPPSIHLESPNGSQRRRGNSPVLMIGLAIGAVVLIAIAAAALTAGGTEEVANIQFKPVERGTLRVTVTDDGNVESARNLDVKCMVEGGSIILWIVPEGSTVKKGDKIVELDAAPLKEKKSQQLILVEKARSTHIQAVKDVEAAEIAIKEYVDGVFEQSVQTAESAIFVAKENLRNSENMLDHSEKMFRRGYVNQLQLESNKFGVERAKLDLAAAETAKRVLVEYTKAKTITQLEAVRDAAKARSDAEKAALDLETTKLKRIEEQLDRCVIHAPQDGLVIFANDRSRRSMGGGASLIEEGAQVRETQSIIRLPDLSQMEVKMVVHETKVDKLRPGMKALVKIRNHVLDGEVVSVSSQPEAGEWFGGNVKQYATNVRILGTTEDSALKPGMTAEVEVLVAEHVNVVLAPVLGVMEIGGKFYCWVKQGSAVEKREVILGPSNDKFLAIQDGLSEGDEIVLNPRSTIAEARVAAEQQLIAPSGAPKANGKANGKAGKNGGPAAGKGGAPTASAVPEAGGSAGPSPKGPPGGGFNLMDNDKDKDGKVSKAEAPEQMQTFFGRMDTNSDGFIDASEAAAARARRGSKAKKPGPEP